MWAKARSEALQMEGLLTAVSLASSFEKINFSCCFLFQGTSTRVMSSVRGI